MSNKISFCNPKWDDDSNSFEIMILLLMMPWIFIDSLIICEPGERVTNEFEEYNTTFNQCKWHKLPIEMQKWFLIFLSDTQQAKYIQGYGGILCARDTFKRVRNEISLHLPNLSFQCDYFHTILIFVP